MLFDSNPSVASLASLSGVQFVGGDLTILGMSGLTSLAGLDGAQLTVEGDLRIQQNAALTSIAALAGVQVTGQCHIYGNDACGACTCESIGLVSAATTTTSTSR
jgi:hypothetical protein